MNLQQALAFLNLSIREDGRYTPTQWISLINAAATEIQTRTKMCRGTVEFTLGPGQRVYSGVALGLTDLLEDPKIGTSKIARKLRSEVIDNDLSTTGTPLYIYPEGMGTWGLYPVPNSSIAVDGAKITMYGAITPTAIADTDPMTTVLPFEPIDHYTLLYGALSIAERTDTDLVISDRIRQQYIDGVNAMMARATNRMSGAIRMKPCGR